VNPADSTPPWFAETLAVLLDRRDLDEAQTRCMIESFVGGNCGEAEMAALLVALRMKGETSLELAEAASVLRERMVPLETGRDDALDTCGTGGDGSATFNISTAVAFVAAAAGVPVVKHGNRAISSRSGSADVLERLGVRLDPDPARARRCLGRVGLAFCLAPHYHPALKHVGALRRRLGVRTLFNCLGPLVNPARTPYQLLGVGRPEWLDLMAGALARLGGTRRALLVSGRDGLDEVTLTGATRVREVRGGQILEAEWTPADFGLPFCTMEELRVDGPDASALLIRRIFEGSESGGAANIVLANAAAALYAAERVASLPEGVERARQVIREGAALRVLEMLREEMAGELDVPSL
jgi:anthranilate phosphoribosyltransferase